MATIEDVRTTLYTVYKIESESKYGIEGKSAEAVCQLIYPSWYDCKTLDDFVKPCGLMVYSYALGPSREHYFYYADHISHPNYYTWESPDFLQTAIDVINSWSMNNKEGK